MIPCAPPSADPYCLGGLTVHCADRFCLPASIFMMYSVTELRSPTLLKVKSPDSSPLKLPLRMAVSTCLRVGSLPPLALAASRMPSGILMPASRNYRMKIPICQYAGDDWVKVLRPSCLVFPPSLINAPEFSSRTGAPHVGVDDVPTRLAVSGGLSGAVQAGWTGRIPDAFCLYERLCYLLRRIAGAAQRERSNLVRAGRQQP